jgi:hypothetical protein
LVLPFDSPRCDRMHERDYISSLRGEKLYDVFFYASCWLSTGLDA